MTDAFLRMLAIIAATFLSMKIAVLAAARREGTRLDACQTLMFLGWFGMRPALFTRREECEGGVALLLKGLRAFAAGAILFAVAHAFSSIYLALPALSLMLHFGVFDIVAGIYRMHGMAVTELFRSPLRARSLTEFWSRRWNIGFSEMISTLVQRPLRRVSASGALYASFLASGLLHELAISVPVRAGYGLPTLYFLIHGALVAFEKKTARTYGRLWTLFWLAAPLPLLFHPPFLRGIVWPLVG